MTGDQATDLLQTQLLQMTATKDGAYLERNRCVALIARMALAMGLRAGTARSAIEGWDEAWHGVVYIELPTGQASWHFHDSQAHLFDGLPAYTGAWDGHDTPEKYRRVGQAFAAVVPTNSQPPALQMVLNTLTAKRGDCVAVHVSQKLSYEQRERLTAIAIAALPDGVHVLALDGGAQLRMLPAPRDDSLLTGLATEELRALLEPSPREPQR